MGAKSCTFRCFLGWELSQHFGRRRLHHFRRPSRSWPRRQRWGWPYAGRVFHIFWVVSFHCWQINLVNCFYPCWWIHWFWPCSWPAEQASTSSAQTPWPLLSSYRSTKISSCWKFHSLVFVSWCLSLFLQYILQIDFPVRSFVRPHSLSQSFIFWFCFFLDLTWWISRGLSPCNLSPGLGRISKFQFLYLLDPFSTWKPGLWTFRTSSFLLGCGSICLLVRCELFRLSQSSCSRSWSELDPPSNTTVSHP